MTLIICIFFHPCILFYLFLFDLYCFLNTFIFFFLDLQKSGGTSVDSVDISISEDDVSGNSSPKQYDKPTITASRESLGSANDSYIEEVYEAIRKKYLSRVSSFSDNDGFIDEEAPKAISVHQNDDDDLTYYDSIKIRKSKINRTHKKNGSLQNHAEIDLMSSEDEDDFRSTRLYTKNNSDGSGEDLQLNKIYFRNKNDLKNENKSPSEKTGRSLKRGRTLFSPSSSDYFKGKPKAMSLDNLTRLPYGFPKRNELISVRSDETLFSNYYHITPWKDQIVGSSSNSTVNDCPDEVFNQNVSLPEFKRSELELHTIHEHHEPESMNYDSLNSLQEMPVIQYSNEMIEISDEMFFDVTKDVDPIPGIRKSILEVKNIDAGLDEVALRSPIMRKLSKTDDESSDTPNKKPVPAPRRLSTGLRLSFQSDDQPDSLGNATNDRNPVVYFSQVVYEPMPDLLTSTTFTPDKKETVTFSSPDDMNDLTQVSEDLDNLEDSVKEIRKEVEDICKETSVNILDDDLNKTNDSLPSSDVVYRKSILKSSKSPSVKSKHLSFDLSLYDNEQDNERTSKSAIDQNESSLGIKRAVSLLVQSNKEMDDSLDLTNKSDDMKNGIKSISHDQPISRVTRTQQFSLQETSNITNISKTCKFSVYDTGLLLSTSVENL